MTKAVVSWEVGLQKISFTKLLQSELGLALDAAKHMTDEMLERGQIEITFDSDEAAALFAEKAAQIGAKVEFSRVSGGRM